MKPLLLLALLMTAACELTPRQGAEPVVTGLGRAETSVEF
jgi:hypothetical protein